jgi:ferrous iron transport protein B
MPDKLTIALAGNPNAGKTTLFNALTGSRQHVGNYPGVTVEKKEGIYFFNNRPINIVDLPGTYSLTAYSVEEVVARDFLVQEKPDAVINITDAANLERNLYLTCQFLEMGLPVVMALNMIDVAKDRGISIDQEKLSLLLGIPVVPIIARQAKGLPELMEAAVGLAEKHAGWVPKKLSYGDDLDSALLEMEGKIEQASFLTGLFPPRWTALKYLEGDQQIQNLGSEENAAVAGELEAIVDRVAAHLQKTMQTYPEAMIADHRYGFIKALVKKGIIAQQHRHDRLYASDRIDRVLTNRLIGPLVMVLVLYGLYQFTFTVSEMPVAWLESVFDWMGNFVDALLPAGQLKSLLVSGIIDGVGGVLGFVPLILCMFFGLAFLEDSGYLARVAFMMDRIFRIFGLHGSSVMAYIVSGGIAGGCAVPGVMATRTLRSPKERMATLLTTPFMNCGAKVPVLALLIGTFFSRNQARFMLLFTLLAWIVALLVAKLLRLTILRGDATPFVMELPPYRFPTFKGLMIHTWEKTWQYIRKAGTIILGFSILIWALMTFPHLPENRIQHYEAERRKIEALAGQEEGTDVKEEINRLEAGQAQEALRYSAAGRLGMAFEKISWLAGFDWRTNIALLGGVAAKEIIVSTLSTVYSLGAVNPEDSVSLSRTLAKDPRWNPVLAVSLIIFIMFYSPCIATVICIAKEAGTWYWGLFSIAFNSVFAFLLATAVYRVGLLF